MQVGVFLRFHGQAAMEGPTPKRDLTISGVYHDELLPMPSYAIQDYSRQDYDGRRLHPHPHGTLACIFCGRCSTKPRC